MSIGSVLFYAFVTTAALAAIFMVFTRNVLHAALALLICLLSVSAIFIFMGAEFLAITQIMVYAGGVVVLIIFGIMLTQRPASAQSMHQYTVPGVLLAFGFFMLLTMLTQTQHAPVLSSLNQADHTRQVGMALMTEYVLPFELSGILLLISLLASAYSATNQQKK